MAIRLSNYGRIHTDNKKACFINLANLILRFDKRRRAYRIYLSQSPLPSKYISPAAHRNKQEFGAKARQQKRSSRFITISP